MNVFCIQSFTSATAAAYCGAEQGMNLESRMSMNEVRRYSAVKASEQIKFSFCFTNCQQIFSLSMT